jgi:hypothetical protein
VCLSRSADLDVPVVLRHAPSLEVVTAPILALPRPSGHLGAGLHEPSPAIEYTFEAAGVVSILRAP